ncbi:hypothetical protein [Candidatus Carsonella ruddii]|uniref:Uncharacterized protein n=1 Tax=Candidatus Carsonella ruddii (Diaphorina cf. continua) TaxID=2661587 RepID=A0A7R6VYD9_CARRU|nr:hypothetical protein [Candidatus Carsonella ruddii (Diaphorina cf. continua)]BCG49251.1 hypothetical protein CRDco_0325 [Candidatus Carsonella ruddii (Diaphorina cf. continua)]
MFIKYLTKKKYFFFYKYKKKANVNILNLNKKNYFFSKINILFKLLKL